MQNQTQQLHRFVGFLKEKKKILGIFSMNAVCQIFLNALCVSRADGDVKSAMTGFVAYQSGLPNRQSSSP